MTTNAQRLEEFTGTELSRFAVRAIYDDLIREAHACTDANELQAVHRFLIELGERLHRDTDAVLSRRLRVLADGADWYDTECGAR